MLKKNQIKILLLKKGITQKQIAEQLGVKPSAVAHCLRGFSKSKRIRQAIAEAVDKPVDRIF